MNQLNFLSKLAMAGVANTIAVVGMTTAPAQALLGGTLEWDDGTDDFIGKVDIENGLIGNAFDVIFSPDGIAAVFIADGHFQQRKHRVCRLEDID